MQGGKNIDALKREYQTRFLACHTSVRDEKTSYIGQVFPWVSYNLRGKTICRSWKQWLITPELLKSHKSPYMISSSCSFPYGTLVLYA